MPTNLLRQTKHNSAGKTLQPDRKSNLPPVLELRIGRIVLRVRLLATPTAERIRAALPLFSAAEPWGAAVHFELPVESERDQTARANARLGEVYYWSEEDRVIIPYGPTPISRDSEIRLPRPCNVWAMALDDVGILKSVSPGAKVSLRKS